MDIVVEMGDRLVLVEIKAGVTASSELAAGIRKLRGFAEKKQATVVSPGLIIYGGDDDRPVAPDRFVSWKSIDAAIQTVE